MTSETNEQVVQSHQSAGGDESLPSCGIIMPISATKSHSEAHWATVRQIVTRAIVKASFEPAPVWENATTDRVSERIIGNIFRYPVVVADISDLNPNVMLELGLRLASKKPTIVTLCEGNDIPFDIKDFHALMYPSSLSILQMEAFIDNLAEAIKAKNEAANKDGYVPFLGNVVVDVVSPDQREVPLGQYVIDRLEDMSARISRLSAARPSSEDYDPLSMNVTSSITNTLGSAIFFAVPQRLTSAVEKTLGAAIGANEIKIIGHNPNLFYYAIILGRLTYGQLKDHLKTVEVLLQKQGGTLSVPSVIADRAAIF